IRDKLVTGVQTCALPISLTLHSLRRSPLRARPRKANGQRFNVRIQVIQLVHAPASQSPRRQTAVFCDSFKGLLVYAEILGRRPEIGRASCRERVEVLVGG